VLQERGPWTVEFGLATETGDEAQALASYADADPLPNINFVSFSAPSGTTVTVSAFQGCTGSLGTALQAPGSGSGAGSPPTAPPSSASPSCANRRSKTACLTSGAGRCSFVKGRCVLNTFKTKAG